MKDGVVAYVVLRGSTMSKYLGSLIIIVLGVACGGTADTGDESGGGSSQGGSQAGGTGGGSAGTMSGGTMSGGTMSGGTMSGGTMSGGTMSGGTMSGGTNAGGAGGGRTYDPRCPARQPMGMCSAEEMGLLCQYQLGSGCLCYAQSPGVFGLCEPVDPNCTHAPLGTAGADGVGGFSAKVALPPRFLCSCSAETWLCSQGY